MEGIIIAAGGLSYLTNAWVCIQMLRRLGCKLPVELWSLNEREFDSAFEQLVAPLGVYSRVASRQSVDSMLPTHGWELKSYALAHTNFSEVILLDADNVPLRNPEFLFETPQFKQTGALFWPDRGRLQPHNPIWGICGVEYRDEPEWESGQIVVDKSRCQEALELALAYNRNREEIYRHVYGDKEAFHLAFRKTNTPVALPSTGVQYYAGVHFQHDFEGRLLFQHRSDAKWRLFGNNRRVPGFLFEDECLGYLDELRARWRIGFPNMTRFDREAALAVQIDAASELTAGEWHWRSGHRDGRFFRFMSDGVIRGRRDYPEVIWDLIPAATGLSLRICNEYGVSGLLKRASPDVWLGTTQCPAHFPVKLSRLGSK